VVAGAGPERPEEVGQLHDLAAADAGATVRFELADQFWGDRYGQVQDPYGFIWSIGAPVKQAQPQAAEQPATA